jgi:hypothetical protein
MSSEPVPSADRSLAGVKLYSPGVLAAYFILGNVPIGTALYGLNVARRGDRLIGYVLLGASLLTLVLLCLAALAGRNLRGWGLLALVMGLGVWRVERGPYRRALQSGAGRARWWPPLIAVFGLLGALVLLLPEE